MKLYKGNCNICLTFQTFLGKSVEYKLNQSSTCEMKSHNCLYYFCIPWNKRSYILLVLQIGLMASYVLWAFSHSFPIFLLSRVVGGICKGNVSLCTAIVADLPCPKARNKGMVSYDHHYQLLMFSGQTCHLNIHWVCFLLLSGNDRCCFLLGVHIRSINGSILCSEGQRLWGVLSSSCHAGCAFFFSRPAFYFLHAARNFTKGQQHFTLWLSL